MKALFVSTVASVIVIGIMKSSGIKDDESVYWVGLSSVSVASNLLYNKICGD